MIKSVNEGGHRVVESPHKDEINVVLDGCFQIDYDKRWTIEKLLTDPYTKSHVDKYIDSEDFKCAFT